MLTLYELARTLGGQASLNDAGDVIARHLRRLISWSLCVFYIYDSTIDELEAKHAVGDGAPLVRGMRIPLGERLSGWVAANRQTISNSDPVLDLGDAARAHSLALRSCISTPLVVDGELIGVLTLYSGEPNAFNEDHRRIIEVVGREIARAFERATTSKIPQDREHLAGLPNLKQLEQFIDAMGIEGVTRAKRLTLLYLDIARIKDIYESHGRSIGDDAVRHVTTQAIALLQPSDILFSVREQRLRRVTARQLARVTSSTPEGNSASISRESVSTEIRRGGRRHGFGVNRRRP